MIRYAVKQKNDTMPPGEFLVVFARNEKDIPFQDDTASILKAELKKREFSGEAGQYCVVSIMKDNAIRAVFFVGMGEKPNCDTIRRGVASATQYAKSVHHRNITIVVSDISICDSPEQIGSAISEGVELGGYVFSTYQSKKLREERKRSVKQVHMYVAKNDLKGVEKGCKTGKQFASASLFARALVNEPAVSMTPKKLADTARDIARQSKGIISVKVANRKECKKLGMGAFLAVAQGALTEPQFIHLTHKPKRDGDSQKIRKVALIGKGVTFDSGGLSLKPSEGMETMKIDMAGAAAVLGVFSQLSVISPNVEVHGFIAACENMPAGNAVRPGDIVRSASGKTIEVRNTDAEGRLTLADAITEAKKIHPDSIIDLATLTGSCVAALGEEIAGLFCNTPALAKQIIDAALVEGEQMWEMPLVGDYRTMIKSSVADVRNIGTKRWGGAITAALFLEEFVEKTPWAHLDIAGPAFAEQQVNPAVPEGGSGFGARTLLQFLQELGEEVK